MGLGVGAAPPGPAGAEGQDPDGQRPWACQGPGARLNNAPSTFVASWSTRLHEGPLGSTRQQRPPDGAEAVPAGAKARRPLPASCPALPPA